MKIRHIGSAAPNDHQAATAHIADKSLVERATTTLPIGSMVRESAGSARACRNCCIAESVEYPDGS